MSRLDKVGIWAGIIGAIAGVIALCPISPAGGAITANAGLLDRLGRWRRDRAQIIATCKKAALERKCPNYRIEMTCLGEKHDNNR